MPGTTKAYDVTNKILAEIMMHALEWGDKHGIDNVAVIAESLRLAAEQLLKIARERGQRCPGSVPYGAPPAGPVN